MISCSIVAIPTLNQSHEHFPSSHCQ